jgi:hypothetical protein
MNKSNWKGSEKKAARLFPGGTRRLRVGMGSYASVADDVVWGPEKILAHSVEKLDLRGSEFSDPPVYIEVKKREKIEAVKLLKEAEAKYRRKSADRLVLVLHVKNDPRQFVLVPDEFFAAMLRSWCHERGHFLEEMGNERQTQG